VVTRKAFTLIELIFAIVIIAISALSLPMMTQVTSKGVKGSLAQEAIFAASTELNNVMTYNWDESSVEGSNSFTRVIWTAANECNNATKLRLGHIAQLKHRRCLDANTTAATHTKEAGINNDLDDTEHGYTPLFIGAIGSKSYKDNYQSDLAVSIGASFGAIANNPDIKLIRVRVIDSNGDDVTQLDTFSSNIGEVDYYGRTY